MIQSFETAPDQVAQLGFHGENGLSQLSAASNCSATSGEMAGPVEAWRRERTASMICEEGREGEKVSFEVDYGGGGPR